ncbi:MAG TPA: SUMF1/EgtB/PvdO family nonheme iron enzyme [Armatimonadota bacterium]|nr:SUMF1/EgtB/PvdO family nonheme iron enzyme [Armatimonadota bacterium]
MQPTLTISVLLSTLAAGLCWSASGERGFSDARRNAEAAATPAGYVYVAGGDCWLGTDDPDAEEDAQPRRRAFVPSFYIGRCEVTQAEWKRFRPKHHVPPGGEHLPITNILRADALAYCRSVGGRLPTDTEWEKAARGPDGRRYPWGDVFSHSLCNLARPSATAPATCALPGARKGLKAVDSTPGGASPYGALNMAGNAWEWVSDDYADDPARGIIRGGAVGYPELAARTYQRAIEGTGVT